LTWLSNIYNYLLVNRDYGGSDFISLVTAFNIAVISWPAFQERLKHAEKKLDAKIASKRVTMAEIHYGHFCKLASPCLEILKKLGSWSWPIAYLLTIASALSGVLMLYVNKSCPFDFILLCPLFFYYAWTWFAILVLNLYLWVIKQGMQTFNSISLIPDLKEQEGMIPDKLKLSEIPSYSPPASD
jgi:hypothetical protein